MIRELDPSPFLMNLTNFSSSRNSSFNPTRSRSRPASETAAEDLPPAGLVVPAYVLRRAGLIDRIPISLTHYPE